MLIRKKGNKEGGEGSNVAGLLSRCSLNNWNEKVGKVMGKASRQQLVAVNRTPFAHFLTAPRKNISGSLVESLIKRYDPVKRGFKIGANLFLEFSPEEFSCVLGLRYAANVVHPKLVMKSSIVGRLFDGDVKQVRRGAIVRKMESLAGRKDSKGDFARLYVLLVFNCLLFPNSNLSTPAFVIHYVDDMDEIWEYAWGAAAYRYLEESMRSYQVSETAKTIHGCTLGLVSWIYERVTTLGNPLWTPRVPRYERWKSSCPSLKECEDLLEAVVPGDVCGFGRVAGEEKFLMQLNMSEVLDV